MHLFVLALANNLCGIGKLKYSTCIYLLQFGVHNLSRHAPSRAIMLICMLWATVSEIGIVEPNLHLLRDLESISSLPGLKITCYWQASTISEYRSRVRESR